MRAYLKLIGVCLFASSFVGFVVWNFIKPVNVYNDPYVCEIKLLFTKYDKSTLPQEFIEDVENEYQELIFAYCRNQLRQDNHSVGEVQVINHTVVEYDEEIEFTWVLKDIGYNI